MTGPELFWTVLAGVLGANLLTFAFVYGAMAWNKLEKEGRDKGNAIIAPLFGYLLPLGMLALAFTQIF